MNPTVFIAAVAFCAAAHGEPVCWTGGEWDETGVPRGVLLSDNPGWWGRRVFTGVTYDYEKGPTNPRDTLKGDKATFGRRLIDGNVFSVPMNTRRITPISKTCQTTRISSRYAIERFRRSENTACAFLLPKVARGGMRVILRRITPG